MITVPLAFREMPRWWHDAAGREWLDRLPSLVAEQCRCWDLQVDGGPLHGSNALVVPVQRGAEAAVLRLAPPGDDVSREAEALRWWDGRGTVRLLEADVPARAMLLERLSARSLQSVPLGEAVPIIADLAARMAVPAPSGATSTDRIAAAHLEEFPRDWERQGRPVPRRQLEIALGLAAELASLPPGGDAADGDLHCEQVLAGEREPWLVVDPVLLRGDLEHDLARVLWSRLDEVADDAELRRLVDLFVRRTGVPGERARAWIVLRSLSYLLWGLDQGLIRDPPKCRRLLDVFA